MILIVRFIAESRHRRANSARAILAPPPVGDRNRLEHSALNVDEWERLIALGYEPDLADDLVLDAHRRAGRRLVESEFPVHQSRR